MSNMGPRHATTLHWIIFVVTVYLRINTSHADKTALRVKIGDCIEICLFKWKILFRRKTKKIALEISK
uniref:CSON013161 protein n=1 Tax=Culicoides sonorensis TaxID=179676 RepID=A0A336MJC9_CULSO